MVKYVTIPLLILSFLLSTVRGQENIAITTKANGTIELKRATQEEFEQLLKIGTKIQNKDRIRTGEDGNGVIIYLDDKTQLKIRKNTTIELQGESEGSTSLAKRVNMDVGKLNASVSEQRRGEFVIATPTSVASVKGTEFEFISDPVLGDLVIVNNGEVELTNNFSGKSVNVGENESGSSTPEGDLDVAVTITVSGVVQQYASGSNITITDISLISGETDQNITGAGPLVVTVNDLTSVDGGEPAQGDKVEINGQLQQDGTFIANTISVIEETHRLEIEFENDNGERKKIEIEYE